MFSQKVVKSTIIAAVLVAGTFAQPSFAAPADSPAAANRSWVTYWLGFLETLDRQLWAQGG
jgi:hypothetical protein